MNYQLRAVDCPRIVGSSRVAGITRIGMTLVATWCLLAGAGTASAGTADAYVTSIKPMRECSSAWNGCVIVGLSAAVVDAASCQLRSNEMALDLNGPNLSLTHHRVMLDVLKLAHDLQARVVVTGTGDCSVHANAETIAKVSMQVD